MQIRIQDLSVEVTRKNIKNINLSVKADGRVNVSAPFCVSEKRITEFVASKLDWIYKQLNRFENIPSEHKYVTGETVFLWGEPYTLEVLHGKRNSVTVNGNVVTLTSGRDASEEVREKILNEWYRELFKEKIAEILPEIEKTTGLCCSLWQVRNMTSCWGTCNTKTKKILLNLQLAKRPVICLQYVIIHELVHTRISNHGADFKLLMDKFMPEWRKIKKLLNTFKT